MKLSLMDNKILLLSVLVLILFTGYKSAKHDQPAYLNPDLPTEQRVNDIISRLTLSQKIKLLQFRGTAVHSNGLDIPAYTWWNECLHGVARSGKATVFPQAIGLAATWDAPFIKNVADAISDEARAKFEYNSKKNKRGIYEGLNFWSPNINIFRDPRWGRGMETYGEDPFLTGTIASAFINGLQGNNPNYYKTIATVKHFVVHSGPEETRSRFNAEVSDRDFYETYTPAFKMAIQDARVYSLMCAYNRFRGTPCCGNDFLLTNLLRNQWGFKGFIVTDCGAVDLFYRKDAHGVVSTPEEAAAKAIKAGVDLECGDVFNTLDKAIAQKLVAESDLDVALRRLFTARFKLGFFDSPEKVPYTGLPYSVVESEAHQTLAKEAARKSIVLLKNERGLLPLKKTIKTIAVIGPNANDEEVLLANYNGYPTHAVTPYEAITKKMPNSRVLYARGSSLVDGFPATDVIPGAYLFKTLKADEHGLVGSYYNNNDFTGEPVFEKTDTTINTKWIDQSPHRDIDEGNFSVNWSGYLKAPKTGPAVLDMYGSSQYELVIDGKTLLKFSSEHGAEHQYASFDFVKGELYKINIRFANNGNSPQIKLNWQLPNVDLKSEALRIAAQADVVVMCMGLSPRIEGEEMKVKLDGFSGGDRTSLYLPKTQETLIKEVAALGKPVVLVLINGSALAINWEDEHIPGIVEAWYGGQQGGNAIADVLFGDYNPNGKLPVTFYGSDTDLPGFENYNMARRTYRYFKGKPLYPFGYGLSYSHFSYSGLSIDKVSPISKVVKISVIIRNTGRIDGDAVAQVYLKHIGASVPVPLKSLKGFQRVFIKAGEQKTIQFNIKPEAFSQINDDGRASVVSGKYQISVGGGQLLNTSVAVGDDNVLSKTIQLIGKTVYFN